jgi:hypothetical protein
VHLTNDLNPRSSVYSILHVCYEKVTRPTIKFVCCFIP